MVHDGHLPGLRPQSFDSPLTATVSLLAERWPHLVRLLAAAVDGAAVDNLQVVGEARFEERKSDRDISLRCASSLR